MTNGRPDPAVGQNLRLNGLVLRAQISYGTPRRAALVQPSPAVSAEAVLGSDHAPAT